MLSITSMRSKHCMYFILQYFINPCLVSANPTPASLGRRWRNWSTFTCSSSFSFSSTSSSSLSSPTTSSSASGAPKHVSSGWHWSGTRVFDSRIRALGSRRQKSARILQFDYIWSNLEFLIVGFFSYIIAFFQNNISLPSCFDLYLGFVHQDEDCEKGWRKSKNFMQSHLSKVARL